jgi:hypothetical protein
MSTETNGAGANAGERAGERVSARLLPASGGVRPRVLFICGSINQTTQMHQIARELPEIEAWFTPYYCDGFLERLRRLGLLGFTILGGPWRRDCMDYLEQRALPIDMDGARGPYELVVTCSDLVVPQNVRGRPLLLVQEGMTDPEGIGFRLRKIFPSLPLWVAGTAGTGLSGLYDTFCVASPGYRDLFVRKGADPRRIAVTGIPNFDDCRAYQSNDLRERGYVLVCTSDARETLKRDNRRRFIQRAVELAAGRPLIFKLHPNENVARSTREIRRHAPGAQVFTRGSAEQMVANCEVLIVQYSTLAYVGLALGKEVHAYADLEELRRLLPLQGGGAARHIAGACRALLGQPAGGVVDVPGTLWSSSPPPPPPPPPRGQVAA